MGAALALVWAWSLVAVPVGVLVPTRVEAPVLLWVGVRVWALVWALEWRWGQAQNRAG